MNKTLSTQIKTGILIALLAAGILNPLSAQSNEGENPTQPTSGGQSEEMERLMAELEKILGEGENPTQPTSGGAKPTLSEIVASLSSIEGGLSSTQLFYFYAIKANYVLKILELQEGRVLTDEEQSVAVDAVFVGSGNFDKTENGYTTKPNSPSTLDKAPASLREIWKAVVSTGNPVYPFDSINKESEGSASAAEQIKAAALVDEQIKYVLALSRAIKGEKLTDDEEGVIINYILDEHQEALNQLLKEQIHKEH